MTDGEIETVEISGDEGSEKLTIEPSTLDIAQLRQDEESKSTILINAKQSQERSQEELENLQKRLSLISAVLYKEQELKSIETYFQNVLLNVSNEQDRSSIISRRHSQIETKPLGLLPLRIGAFNFAIDYNNGSNQQFIKFKEALLDRKFKAIDEELERLQNQINEKQSIINQAEDDLKEEYKTIEEKINKMVESDNAERTRLAKQKIEEIKAQKLREEEIQYNEEVAEKERLKKLKEEEERKAREEEEAKNKAENDALLSNLRSKGYSEEKSLLIDEKTKLPQTEIDEPITANRNIKIEPNGNDDRTVQLQNSFKENDRPGRIALRAKRAEKRKLHLIRKQRGDTNVSSDDEWREEIDGVFSDEEQSHIGHDQDSDIGLVDGEDEAFHVLFEEDGQQKKQQQKVIIEPSPSYPIDSTTRLNTQPSYIPEHKPAESQAQEQPQIQPTAPISNQHPSISQLNPTSQPQTEPQSRQDEPAPIPKAIIPSKRPPPEGASIFNRPKDPRIRKRLREAVGHLK